MLPNGSVLMSLSEFHGLGNYSCTLPTGTKSGKMWKRAAEYSKQDLDDRWIRGCYGEPYPEGHKYHGQIPIEWRPIVVDGAAIRYRIWLEDGTGMALRGSNEALESA